MTYLRMKVVSPRLSWRSRHVLGNGGDVLVSQRQPSVAGEEMPRAHSGPSIQTSLVVVAL